MTTAASYRSTTGEPMGPSPTITVQDAVPPRISGPYEGIQKTSSPSLMPARASTCPGEEKALATEPGKDNGTFHVSPPSPSGGCDSRTTPRARSTMTPSG